MVRTWRGWLTRLLTVALVGAIALLLWPSSPALAAESALTVYRSPSCRCCGHWVEHMEAAGFEVQSIVTDDMAVIKAQYGVPEELASCHTAILENYRIEGHVPAADVQRLLRERPDILGIAAPGMPVGAPGMEMGNRVDPYTVVTFAADTPPTPFAEHP
ncbi:DUF411 domain-containing protein [Nodosilinea sp. E11]|uniref:DUF411 domain-containing protein n=1 Tax=Nodosilinea sp. E11 TaxID=3037479 RepID=UPI002934898E|nr:DUF411 domain-containing protein [Nodosilinea sp. E11]WOD40076.1 DUF411 domain-containing protein [Nodosilinea sp. E11]